MKTENILIIAAGLAAGYYVGRKKTDSAIGKVSGEVYISYIDKEIVEDDYNEGETGNRQTIFVDSKLGIYDSKNVLSKIADKYGLDSSDKSKWMAFEDGRIIYSQLEDEDGSEASKSQIERWKQGNQKLYSASYNIGIDKAKTSPATVNYLVKELGIKSYDMAGIGRRNKYVHVSAYRRHFPKVSGMTCNAQYAL